MNDRPPPSRRAASRPTLVAPGTRSATPGPATLGTPTPLSNRRITVCVTGSVAAYKAVLLVRLLMKQGASVEVVLSRSAREFVAAATFSGLTGQRVYSDLFDAEEPGEVHVRL